MKEGNFRKMRMFLIISVALNLLVLGAVAGAALRMRSLPPLTRHVAPVAMSLRDLGFGPYERALSRGDQRLMVQALRARARELDQNRAQLRRQVKELIGLLRQSPYDPGKVRALVERQLEGLRARQELGKQLFLERLAAMSDSERAAYAKRLARMLLHDDPKG